MHKSLEKISEIKNELVCCVDMHLSKGIQNVDTEEMGEVIDMIKDLAEAEKECWEACYYKSIYEAMEGYGENDRQGYDSWRYNSGRFAPTGRGHYDPAGYSPVPGSFMMEDDFDMMLDGYTRSGSGNRSQSGNNPPSYARSGRSGYSPMSRHGKDYDDYEEYKRHYSESHSADDKQKMEEHARKHLEGSMETMRDIWRNADPQLKSKMKQDLSSLINNDLK